MIRPVNKTITGREASDGAGVSLIRVLSRRHAKDFDPFLMLDAFDLYDPESYRQGFPWHPHRGIETITYLLAGDIRHADSLGNQGKITDGDFQWMTAGSGIIHQEMPQPVRRLFGTQLWLNLPASDKMCEPAYHDVRNSEIPVVEEPAATIRILAGSYLDTPGAVSGQHVNVDYLDVELDPDGEWSVQVQTDHTVFAFILEGHAHFGAEGETVAVEAMQAVLLGDGDETRVKASVDGARFLLLSARPLNQPLAWEGSIAMNTPEQVHEAYRELQDGSFIKHKEKA